MKLRRANKEQEGCDKIIRVTYQQEVIHNTTCIVHPVMMNVLVQFWCCSGAVWGTGTLA